MSGTGENKGMLNAGFITHQSKQIRWCVLGLTLLLMTACSKSAEEQLADAREQLGDKDYATAVITLKNLLQDSPDNVDGRLLLAEVSLTFGDPLAAAKELQRAQDLGADAADHMPLHYQIQLAVGNNTGVLELLSGASGEEGITAPQAAQYRGEALLGLGRSIEAEEAFRRALDIDPFSADALWGVAAALASAGQAGGAQAYLERLASEHPQYSRGWLLRGQTELRAGELEAAEISFTRAVETARAEPNRLLELPALTGLADAQLSQAKIDIADQTIRALSNFAGRAPVTRFLHARIAAAREDYELAANELEQVLAVAPNNLSALLLYGSVQIALENYATAEGALSQVVARAPQNLAARRLLAAAQFEMSEPRAAVETIAPLLESAESDSRLTVFASQALIQSGSIEEALRLLEEAVEQEPDNIELNLSLAAVYLQAQRPDDAVKLAESVPDEAGSFRKDLVLALALAASDRDDEAEARIEKMAENFGDDVQALTLVGDYYLRRDVLDKARQRFGDAVAIDDDNIPARIGLARVAVAADNDEGAVTAFEAVLQRAPQNLTALISLANLAAIDGDLEKSQRLLLRATEANESAAMPRLMLAQTYLRQGNRLRAEQTAQEAARLAEDNAAIQLGAGDILVSVGKSREALPYLIAATELRPGSLGAWFNLARAHLALDQTIDARRALDRALEIDSDDLRSQTTMALVEMGDGNADQALQIAAELKALYPESATPINLEADIYFAQQQFEQAAALYREAFEISPSSILARRAFQAARSAGRDDAAETLEVWIADNPDDATTTLFLAQENDRLGVSAEAIVLYERVLAGDPNNVAALNNLAWILNEQGDSDKAEPLARKAYKLRPDIGSVADTLGWILLRQGKIEEAADFIEEAAAKSSRSGDIQYHLAYVWNEVGRTSESLEILQALLATEDDFNERDNVKALLAEIKGQQNK